MAVMMTVEFPATPEQYDAVNAELDVDNNPADGLIIHTGAEVGPEMIRVTDVWESEDHWNRWRDGRLGAAIVAVMGEPPADAPPADFQITELRTVVNP